MPTYPYFFHTCLPVYSYYSSFTKTYQILNLNKAIIALCDTIIPKLRFSYKIFNRQINNSFTLQFLGFHIKHYDNYNATLK